MEGDLESRILQLLGDAANQSCMMHTRVSAAVRALAWCCDAGLGGDADRATVSGWEDRRYSVALQHPPSERELAQVVSRVRDLLAGRRQR